MYAFVDRRVTSLDRGGQFLIWSMRKWVWSLGEGKCPVPAIAPAFAKWGMMAGLTAFHKAMIILNTEGLETSGFGPLQCGCISEHEAIMLSYFHAFRAARPEQVKEMASMLVDEDSVHPFVLAATQLASLLAAQGLMPGLPSDVADIAAQNRPQIDNTARKFNL